VDYFKFLPLNSPGVNKKMNEVESFYNLLYQPITVMRVA